MCLCVGFYLHMSDANCRFKRNLFDASPSSTHKVHDGGTLEHKSKKPMKKYKIAIFLLNLIIWLQRYLILSSFRPNYFSTEEIFVKWNFAKGHFFGILSQCGRYERAFVQIIKERGLEGLPANVISTAWNSKWRRKHCIIKLWLIQCTAMNAVFQKSTE